MLLSAVNTLLFAPTPNFIAASFPVPTIKSPFASHAGSWRRIPCPPKEIIKSDNPAVGAVVNLIVLVFGVEPLTGVPWTILKSSPGFWITPPRETIRFAELPNGVYATPTYFIVKSFRVPLNWEPILSRTIEFPVG